MSTTEKALTVTDKAIGAALALSEPVVKSGCKLMEDLLGKPCEVVGGMLTDQLYAWQWRNRIRIANRAKEILEKEGVAASVMPTGFFLPFLNASGNTEDPTLQELWAQLLASAATNETHRKIAFIKRIEELTSEEALMLASIYSAECRATHVNLTFDGDNITGHETDHLGKTTSYFFPRGLVAQLIDCGPHLNAIGLVNFELRFDSRDKDGIRHMHYDIFPSDFGITFANAVFPLEPSTADEASTVTHDGT